MHCRQREHKGQLADEVAVAGAVEAVGRHPGKAERCRHCLAIDRQARAGQRPRAEREDVGANAAVGQSLPVALKFLTPRQQLVGRQHRLGSPHVGVAGDDESLLPFGQREKCPLEFLKRSVDAIDRAAAVEPQIGSHLIVAAAGGVELAAGVAETGGQRRFNMEVDIFLGGGELKAAGADLLADLLKHSRDLLRLGLGDQAGVGEHGRVGDRAVDIVVGESLVVRDALGKSLDAFVGRLAEDARPGLVGACGPC